MEGGCNRVDATAVKEGSKSPGEFRSRESAFQKAEEVFKGLCRQESKDQVNPLE